MPGSTTVSHDELRRALRGDIFLVRKLCELELLSKVSDVVYELPSVEDGCID